MATYNDANYKLLIAKFDALSTYAAVAEWDAQAQAEARQLSAAGAQAAIELAQAREAIKAAQAEFDNRNFLSKLFGGKTKISETQIALSRAEAHKRLVDDMAEKLDALITFTPNDIDEQKATIKALKQHKKELQQQKREIASQVREIRVDARQKTATVYATSDKQNIRLRKEAALAPHEDHKTAIERQLLTVDKRIIWLERFSTK